MNSTGNEPNEYPDLGCCFGIFGENDHDSMQIICANSKGTALNYNSYKGITIYNKPKIINEHN